MSAHQSSATPRAAAGIKPEQRPWSAAEQTRALALRAAGKGNIEIGVLLDRTTKSVAKKFEALRRAQEIRAITARIDIDMDRAYAMAKRGVPWREIADILGVHERTLRDRRRADKETASVKFAPGHSPTVRANIRAALASIAVRKREAKAAQPQRKCLRCGDMFPSWGPGNRRCEPCSGSVAATGMSAWL